LPKHKPEVHAEILRLDSEGRTLRAIAESVGTTKQCVLQVLQRNGRRPPRGQRLQTDTSRDAEIVDMYKNRQMSLTQISEATGKCIETVRQRLRAHAVAMRPAVTSPDATLSEQQVAEVRRLAGTLDGWKIAAKIKAPSHRVFRELQLLGLSCDTFHDERIKSLYADLKSTTKVARAVGKSLTFVYARLRSNGVIQDRVYGPPRPRARKRMTAEEQAIVEQARELRRQQREQQSARKQRIVDLARSGKTYVEIAEMYGITRQRVQQICRQAGFLRRQRGET
jgi:predicted transcriptional regulator